MYFLNISIVKVNSFSFFFIVVLPIEIRGKVRDLERRKIRTACDASLVSSSKCAIVLTRYLQYSAVYRKGP